MLDVPLSDPSSLISSPTEDSLREIGVTFNSSAAAVELLLKRTKRRSAVL